MIAIVLWVTVCSAAILAAMALLAAIDDWAARIRISPKISDRDPELAPGEHISEETEWAVDYLLYELRRERKHA